MTKKEKWYIKFYKENEKIYCTVKGALEKVLEFCTDVDKEKVKKQNEELIEKAHSNNTLDSFNACNELLSE